MKSVIKIRLYPTKRQKHEIFKQFSVHKELYNKCLEQKRDLYQKEKKTVSCYDQIKTVVKEFKNLSNYSSLQQTVRRLDKSFQNFFRRIKNKEEPGYPRFKHKFNSIEYCYGDGCKIRGSKAYFQHIGEIKGIFHRAVNNPSRCSLSYRNGDFFACFTVESIPKTPKKTGRVVGIDFGLKSFITTSENDKIQNPKFHKRHLVKLGKLQRQRSETKSKEIYRKKTRQIQKTWKRICNLRHEFNHKETNKMLSQYDTICLEKLGIRNLQGNVKNINRTYSDVCWNQFTNILSYKAANAGKEIVFVNPAYTSKKCSKCGKIHDLSLKDREIHCSCGNHQDRDYNAACNILTLGLQSIRAQA